MFRIQNNAKILLAQKELRERRTITYREVAEQTDISPHAVSNYMNQRIKNFNEGTLIALCTYLDCTIGDLLEIVPDDAAELPPTADKA